MTSTWKERWQRGEALIISPVTLCVLPLKFLKLQIMFLSLISSHIRSLPVHQIMFRNLSRKLLFSMFWNDTNLTWKLVLIRYFCKWRRRIEQFKASGVSYVEGRCLHENVAFSLYTKLHRIKDMMPRYNLQIDWLLVFFFYHYSKLFT